MLEELGQALLKPSRNFIRGQPSFMHTQPSRSTGDKNDQKISFGKDRKLEQPVHLQPAMEVQQSDFIQNLYFSCILKGVEKFEQVVGTFPRRSRASGVPIFSSNLSISVSTRLTKNDATLVTLDRSLSPEASRPSRAHGAYPIGRAKFTAGLLVTPLTPLSINGMRSKPYGKGIVTNFHKHIRIEQAIYMNFA
uniref:Uncharacterized protein n=1 Tax=Solanum lycopersicum TaxID=4081 RepID=A0A494G8E7_SOLLC